MAAHFPSHPFWDFSLALYGRPDVAPACLVLQERHGLDINVLMYCLWLARENREPRDFKATLDAVAEWHGAIVRGLRTIRQRLKRPVGGADLDLALALRARVQKIEIDAEHIEQLALASGATAAPRSDAAQLDRAIELLRAYWRRLGIEPQPTDRSELAVVLGACFAEAGITAALERQFR